MDETVQTTADPERDWHPSGLDLIVSRAGAPEVRWPLCRKRTRLGSEPGCDVTLPDTSPTHALLHFEGEALYLTSTDTAAPVVLNGRAVGLAEVKPGDVLEIGPHRIRIAQLAAPAYLEAYGEPFGGQLFMVGPEATPIGRPGKRANRVELSHPTISRGHATVTVSGGAFQLLAESSTSLCQINGRALAAGESGALADGDLVGLGDLMFRFRLVGPAATVDQDRRLRFYSLGPLRVFVGQRPIPETGFRSTAARYLLAYVSAEWDRPVPVELLLDLFWPDLPPDRARRNLNWCVSTLRQALRGDEKTGEYLVRTHQSVQLEPDCLGSHDLVDLRAALAEGPEKLRAGDPTPLRLALEIYQGPYLDGCYMDWALERRTQLEQALQAGGLELLRADLEATRHPQALATARRLLQLDPCCQEACLGGMQAARLQGRAEEAVRLFEACKQQLHKELGMEPSIELMRERMRL